MARSSWPNMCGCGNRVAQIPMHHIHHHLPNQHDIHNKNGQLREPIPRTILVDLVSLDPYWWIPPFSELHIFVTTFFHYFPHFVAQISKSCGFFNPYLCSFTPHCWSNLPCSPSRRPGDCALPAFFRRKIATTWSSWTPPTLWDLQRSCGFGVDLAAGVSWRTLLD